MKFSIGDKVLLKRTGEEGHVTAAISDHMLEVEVNGTAFPVHADDLEHPYLKWFTEKNAKKKKATTPEQLPVEKIVERGPRLAKGIYLSFMPTFKTVDMEELTDTLKIYLLNETPNNIRFSYDVRFATKSDFSHEGALHAFGNVFLHSIPYTVMNEQPRFHWELASTSQQGMGKESGVLRIRPAKLFEHITQIMQHSGPTFSYLLTEDFKPAKKEEPLTPFLPMAKPQLVQQVTAKNIEASRNEIDLHIEAIANNKKGFSNAEIIKIQLDTLQHYLHLAIVHRQERLIVIHGLGKGKLREEVHAILKTIPEVSRFKNEWSGRYGFGATEVWFRY